MTVAVEKEKKTYLSLLRFILVAPSPRLLANLREGGQARRASDRRLSLIQQPLPSKFQYSGVRSKGSHVAPLEVEGALGLCRINPLSVPLEEGVKHRGSAPSWEMGSGRYGR